MASSRKSDTQAPSQSSISGTLAESAALFRPAFPRLFFVCAPSAVLFALAIAADSYRGLIALAAALIVSFAAAGAGAWTVSQVASGQPAGPAAAWRASFRRIGTLIGVHVVWMALLALALTLSFAIVAVFAFVASLMGALWLTSFVLPLFAGVVGGWVFIVWVFVPEAVILDKARTGAALRRSLSVYRGRFWSAVSEVVVAIIPVVVLVALADMTATIATEQDTDGLRAALVGVALALGLPWAVTVKAVAYLRWRDAASTRNGGLDADDADGVVNPP